MIEIYLDGVQLEVPQDISIGLNLSVADYADPITASGAYTQTVEIPRTPHNDIAFKFSGEVLSTEMFNHSEHTARIVEDGCELVGGRAYLEGVSQTSYNMQVVGEEVGWVENIRDKKLSDIDGEAIGVFSLTRWSNIIGKNSAYLRFPALFFSFIQHGCWNAAIEDTEGKEQIIPRNYATFNDLVPFVQIYELLRHIFSNHEIVCGTALERVLRMCYVSMPWREDKNAKVIKEDNDFDIESKGQFTTRQYPNRAYAPIFNIFNTIDDDKNGVLKNNAIYTDIDGIEHTVIDFRPTIDCTITPHYKFNFRTSVGYVSNTNHTPYFANCIFNLQDANNPILKLSYRDSVNFANRKLSIQHTQPEFGYNNLAWKIDNLTVNPHKMGLFYLELDEPEKYSEIGLMYGDLFGTKTHYPYTNIPISNRIFFPCAIGHNEMGIAAGPYLKNKDTGKYTWLGQLSTPDSPFAYDTSTIRLYGLSKVNQLEFDLDFIGAAIDCKAISSDAVQTMAINPMGIRVGEPYAQVEHTITAFEEGAKLTPIFTTAPQPFEDVKLANLGGDTSVEDVLRSIMQLYNLIIYTNPKTKQVYLYMFADFWNNNIVDWSDRIDIDKEIAMENVGDSIGNKVMLKLADGNKAVEYYNERHEEPYSSFSRLLSTKMIKQEKEITNGLFTPTIEVGVNDVFNSLVDAQNTLIPTIVRKDEKNTSSDFSIQDVPNMIVSVSNYGSGTPNFPFDKAIFGTLSGYPSMHQVVEDIALSFADKDGIEGLHKHYDKQIALWEEAKRLTCYCRVEAWEIEALRYNAENINFRSLFRLNIKGEDIYGRLESIEYEPSNTTNKCVFIIE